MSGTSQDKDQGAAAAGPSEGQDSLEDLLSTLSKQINSSDWLSQNTAEKFEADNPEVAKVFKDLADEKKKKEQNSSGQS